MSPLVVASLLLVVAWTAATTTDLSTNDTCSSDGLWSSLLVQWATSDHSRQGRILSLPSTNGYYVTDRIDRPSLPPPRSPYDEWPANTPPPPPGKIVNRPPHKDKIKPSYMNGKPIQMPARPYPSSRPPVDRVDEPPRKSVSETDLYLLGAIEKLVYRVDVMEKRLRKMEEGVHYLMAGGEKIPEKTCAEKYSLMDNSCYHFSREELDWKSANLACRKIGGFLLEVDSEGERTRMVAALQPPADQTGIDFWTGGLNPGLLWIWSNSARPVITNSSSPSAPVIHGEGRCLALSYEPPARSHKYRGQDCALRQRYVCETSDDNAAAAISNDVHRAANGAGGVSAGGANSIMSVTTVATQHARTTTDTRVDCTTTNSCQD